MLYSLGALLETSVSDQDFFGPDTALLHKAKNLFGSCQTSKPARLLGLLEKRYASPKRYDFILKSAWHPKGLLSKITDLHSPLAFDSLTQLPPSHFYMLLKTQILKLLYNLDFFPSRKGAKQPADKCNFGSREDLPWPTPSGFVLPIICIISLFLFLTE